MRGITVRVRKETHELLRELAEQTGESVQDVLAKAVEAYRRQFIWQRTNAAYAALRADADSWSEVEEERRLWESTVTDGL